MIIRRKVFTNSQSQPENNSITSKDLQIEQGRLQRELIKTQRLKQKMQAEEREDSLKRIVQLQKMEQKKDIEDNKDRIRLKKLEEDNNSNSSNIYKSRPHPVAPVPMK